MNDQNKAVREGENTDQPIDPKLLEAALMKPVSAENMPPQTFIDETIRSDRAVMKKMGILIEQSEEEKKIEHSRNMFTIWERVMENQDLAVRKFPPEMQTTLKSNPTFLTVLIQSKAQKPENRAKFLSELFKEQSSRQTEKNAKLLNEESLKQIELLTEKSQKLPEIFSSTGSSAKLYEGNFGGLKKDEFYFLCALTYLDIQASFLDQEDGGKEKPSLSILDRFIQAEKNYRQIEDATKNLTPAQKQDFEHFDSNFVKDLKSRNEIKKEEVEELKSRVADITETPDFSLSFKNEITKTLGNKDSQFIKVFSRLKRLHENERDEETRKLLAEEVGLSDQKIAVALRLVERTNVYQEYKEAA